MKDTISILSLNVNGLRDEVKCIRLFWWLKNNHFDLIFLQDVRWSEEDGESWSSQWGRLSCW
jgi:exonuclease III